MEENFKSFVEELKEENMDSQTTKEYIKIIKKVLDHNIEISGDEISRQEVLQDFIEEYNEELNLDPDKTIKFLYNFSQYNSYKEILKMSKSNKSKFVKSIKEAKAAEKASPEERLISTFDSEKQVITTLRFFFRRIPNLNEKDLLRLISEDKSEITRHLKSELITSIQKSISFLNEYGFLDEYIKEANKELKDLNLDGLKFEKRCPLPDEMGDGKGNIIKYNEKGILTKYSPSGEVINDGEDLSKYEEDIGVLDFFDKDNLEKLSPEELLLIDTFWRGQYLKERLEISKAMATIGYLDLWPAMIGDSEKFIDKLDDGAIANALKRDLALTYLYKQDKNITLRMKMQYSRFLKDIGMVKKDKIEVELANSKHEIDNLITSSRDLSWQQCIVINKLKDKDFSVKNWGTVKDKDDDKMIKIMIEAQNFRGPLIISMDKSFFDLFVKENNLKVPEYKNDGKIDSRYLSVMTKLYLPFSNYFRNYTKRKYEENPESELLASLVGKKAKKVNPDAYEDPSI